MAKINFDGIDTPGDGDGTFIPNGYAGMNWDNFGALDPTQDFNPSGYVNGIRSGDSVGYNAFATPATMSTAGNDFDLKKGYFTGAWNNGLQVTVQAYDDGNLIATKVFTVDYDGPTKVKFGHHFKSIDTVIISSAGGTDATGDDGFTGEHVAVEDLTVKFHGGGGPDHVHDHVHEHHLNHVHQTNTALHEISAGWHL
jgi:hypothetical protein